MKKLQNRVERLDPLLKMKQAAVEQEAIKLTDLQHKRLGLQTKLEGLQQNYLNGVDKINTAKIANDRMLMGHLEKGNDYYKSCWALTLHEIKDMEKRILAQTSLLKDARAQCRAVEMLQEKYKREIEIFKQTKMQNEIEERVTQMATPKK